MSPLQAYGAFFYLYKLPVPLTDGSPGPIAHFFHLKLDVRLLNLSKTANPSLHR